MKNKAISALLFGALLLPCFLFAGCNEQPKETTKNTPSESVLVESQTPSVTGTESTASSDETPDPTTSPSEESASPSEESASPSKESASPSKESASPSEESPSKPEKSEYRVLLASDIHNNNQLNWYGVSNEKRMEMFVSAVNAEHEKQPFDLILLLGDYSLDFWVHGGSVLNNGKSNTKDFMKNIASKFPADVPVFYLPGNHEQYGNEAWKNITGNDRFGTVVLGDNVFVMLDTFAGNLDPTGNSDGTYTGIDMEYLEEQFDSYPNANFYICAHYINQNSEMAKLRKLTAEHDNIVGFFMGHDHKTTVIQLGNSCQNKTIAQLGNFSYGKGGSSETENYYWGFRDLVITPDRAVSRYIVAESNAVINGSAVHRTRRLISQLEYYPNAGLLEDEPDLTPKPPVEPSLGIDKLNTVLTELKKENAAVPESGTTVLFTKALSDCYDIRSATALKFDVTFHADADLTLISGVSQFEITSSGKYDRDESNWDAAAAFKALGSVTAGQKVTITLHISDLKPETKAGSQELDLERVNFLRWYFKNAGVAISFTADNFRFE